MKTLEDIRGGCRMDDGHWIWCGGLKTKNGRPVVYAPDITKGGAMKSQAGPRAAYHLFTGQVIPPGWRVYGCDERLCLNPAHGRCMSEVQWGALQVQLGTQRGQTKRILANRATSRARAKVTPEIIRAIQMSDKTGIALAAEFSLSPQTVSKARRGQCRIFQGSNHFASGLGAR